MMFVKNNSFTNFCLPSNKLLLNVTSHKTEAVVQRCSVKKVLLDISQNSQKTPVRESILIKLQASGLQLYLKRDSGTGVFL